MKTFVQEKNYFSSNLKWLRVQRKYTQTALAEKLSQGTQWNKATLRGSIIKYEDGKTYPKLDMLIHLAKFFGYSLDELVFVDLRQGLHSDKVDNQQNIMAQKQLEKYNHIKLLNIKLNTHLNRSFEEVRRLKHEKANLEQQLSAAQLEIERLQDKDAMDFVQAVKPGLLHHHILTEEQFEVLLQSFEGESVHQIAKSLNQSDKETETQIKDYMHKFNKYVEETFE